MINWVCDCSLALAWVLPDESSERAERFLAEVTANTVLWVPALWSYELANALIIAQRRRRLLASDGVRVIELYASLPIAPDTHLNSDMAQRSTPSRRSITCPRTTRLIWSLRNARASGSRHWIGI